MNDTLTLIRYASVEGKGWRRGAAVFTKNGRLKPDAMRLGGIEVHCPNGCYQSRQYQGKNPIYTELGKDPTDALDRFRAEETKLKARAAAVAAGLEVVSPEGRKTLRQYAAAFLAMHRNLPHRSDDSLQVYTMVTGSFIKVCKVAFPEDVSKDDVIRWHGWMRNEEKYSDRTAANRYLALRGFLRYCGVEPGRIIPKGTHKLLKTYTKKVVNAYTPEVVQKLIDAATDEDKALLWEFAYKTGLRDSELQMVTRYDLHGLDTDEPILHVKERDEYGNIKDAEERKIELHPALVLKLRKWLEKNPRKVLLFGTRNDKPDTKMLLALKVTARRANLNCGHCSGCKSKRNECREFTLHCFRRTFTTRMLQATGGDLRSVMLRTGHEDLATVMRYLAPEARIREAVAAAF
jgi:integrase